MNLTRLRLENFKRFTDLTIELSSFAGAPKLVLLIGANGSSKSWCSTRSSTRQYY